VADRTAVATPWQPDFADELPWPGCATVPDVEEAVTHMAHRHVVLLIDDHADGLEAAQALIETHGFEVVGTSSAEDALTRLRGGLPCCIVVLDWKMPGMGGEEFVRALSAEPRLAKLRLLVLTGDARGVSRARELGVDHVALKPIDPDLLLEIIGEHCSSSSAA
jgi:CheY-like chemotaxis protein